MIIRTPRVSVLLPVRNGNDWLIDAVVSIRGALAGIGKREGTDFLMTA